MVLLDLLERQAALLLHEVDQAQVARPEDHDLAAGDVVLRALRRLGARGLVHGVPHHRPLLVTAGVPGHLAAGERSLHQLVESIAVALFERRALVCPWSESTRSVRPRRVPPRVLDAELLVELAQGLERVGSLEARGAPPRRSSRRSRTPRGARASCRSRHRRRWRYGRSRTAPRAGRGSTPRGAHAGARRGGPPAWPPSAPAGSPRRRGRAPESR